MHILITRDTYNGTFATRTFDTEQDVLTVLRDEMLDTVKHYSNNEADYDKVADVFDTLPSVEPGFTRTRTQAFDNVYSYVEMSRTLGGRIHVEAECSDKDEDTVYEWFVDYIDPSTITN